jgi:ketosteroid isomerase-like protein
VDRTRWRRDTGQAMSRENVEVVRAVYARWAHGDFSASLPLFDANLALVIDPEIPEGGTYVGSDGVREYMSRFLDSWESLTIAGESFEEVGDTVLVEVRQRGIGRGSGAPVETGYFQLWTFRGTKVVRLEVILSERRALEAVGLSE